MSYRRLESRIIPKVVPQAQLRLTAPISPVLLKHAFTLLPSFFFIINLLSLDIV